MRGTPRPGWKRATDYGNIEPCACLDCCRLDPSRLALREARNRKARTALRAKLVRDKKVAAA